MKLIHTSDWHLGKIIYGRSILEDQKAFLYDMFLPLIDSEKPDGIMVSGDIFDRSIAPVGAIRLFDDIVDEICNVRDIPLFVSVGNHDGADRFSVGTSLLCKSGFYLSLKLQSTIEPIVLNKDGVKTCIYMLPFFDPQAAKEVLSGDSLNNVTDIFKEVISNTEKNIDNDAVNILMAHCFVTGAKVTDDTENSYVGSLQEMDSSVFAPFDYVALGHLHVPQKAGVNGRYSGSPLKYSFDEGKKQKSITILDINKKSDINIRLVPIVPLKEMRTITGTFDEIVGGYDTDNAKQDYIFANILGSPVFEPMARLKELYPNILGLVNGIEQTEFVDSDRAALRQELRRTKPDETVIFSSFLSQICGVEATDEDIKIFKETIKELGGDR